MDFRRLEAFCQVYTRRSFSRAGEDLFLSQPTISAHVQALERELNTRLFDRLGRTVMPTPAGDALYARSREVFQLLDLAKAEVHSMMDRVSGVVSLGASTIPAESVLPCLLAGFLQSNPDVSLRMETASSATITEAVVLGSCMLGVVGAQEDRSDLAYHELMRDRLICVAASTFPNARDQLPLHTRLQQPWVMRAAGSGTRRAMEDALSRSLRTDQSSASPGMAKQSPLQPRLAMEVSSTQTMLACVAAGMGLAVTSRVAAEPMLARGELVVVPLPELEMERSFWCVTHSQRLLFPAAKHCLDYLLAHAAEIAVVKDA